MILLLEKNRKDQLAW